MKLASEYEKIANEIVLAKKDNLLKFLQEQTTVIEKTIEKEANKGRFYIDVFTRIDSSLVDNKTSEDCLKEIKKIFEESGYFISNDSFNLNTFGFRIFWNEEEYKNSLPKPKSFFKNNTDRY